MNNPIKQFEGKNITTSCANCDAWEAGTGECHKRSPVVITDGYEVGGAGYLTIWPETKLGDWCCEWVAE